MEDILFEVTLNQEVAKDIYKLNLRSEEKLPKMWAGQFLQIEVPDQRLILRRPFCIYDFSENELTTYYAVVGKGTKSLTSALVGSKLKALLPLGNGFDISGYKKIALLGGGMGCAELFAATKTPNKDFYAYFGFTDKHRIAFLSDFQKTCKELYVCTNDGSYGVKGYPMPKLLEDIHHFDCILVCGPLGMVKSIQTALKDISVPAFVALEQRMGCGMGACLVCTCKIDDNGSIKNKRVCMDGPVFNLKDVVL